jgi:hypothetical protein
MRQRVACIAAVLLLSAPVASQAQSARAALKGDGVWYVTGGIITAWSSR